MSFFLGYFDEILFDENEKWKIISHGRARKN